MKAAPPSSPVPVQPRDRLAELDAARYIGMSPAFLRKQRRIGRPPAYSRLGRRVVYDRRDLDALLMASRIDPSTRRA